MNNREIKFRIWDGIDKKYLSNMDMVPLFLDKNTFMPACGYHGLPYTYQQYIGIQDKNNKEIYEGDILTGHMGYSTDTKLTGVVEFSTETLGYGLRFNPNPDPNPDSNPGTIDSLTEDLCLVHDLEVIGNIYENRDLAERFCLI